MNDWTQIIGQEAANQLAQTYSGCKYLVPTSLESPSGQELSGIIGEPAAKKLIHLAAGDTFYVPQSLFDEKAIRQELIQTLHKGGMTPARISQVLCFTTRYSERYIRSLLKTN